MERSAHGRGCGTVDRVLQERRTQVSTLARWWLAGHFVNPLRLDLEVLQTPWYHDFTPFGLPTPQLPGIYKPNQASKSPTLFDYIERALDMLPSGASRSVLEYFCADGFYALHACRSGAESVGGVDLDEAAIRKARLIAAVLKMPAVKFDVADVFQVPDVVDISICAGGLYHISDPSVLLAKLRSQTRHALVLQTVIHNAIEEPSYFETPAPGWTWGCRFSWAYLLRITSDAGWRIVDSRRGELSGNDRPEDRGTAFLLCKPDN
jgi:2-polyprenyl-3-methyl-5-hydroxy-6-metoxy-1,4-benzoquinol methylase